MIYLKEIARREAFNDDIPAGHALDHIRTPEAQHDDLGRWADLRSGDLYQGDDNRGHIMLGWMLIAMLTLPWLAMLVWIVAGMV